MNKQANIFRSIILSASILLATINSVLAQDKSSQQGTQSSDEVLGYTFEMKGCQRQRKALVCAGKFTSPYENKLLLLDSLNTTLTNESGDQYLAESVSAGTGYNYDMTPLVKDIPLKVTIIFRNIPNSGKTITLITFATKFTGTFQLRNVSVSN